MLYRSRMMDVVVAKRAGTHHHRMRRWPIRDATVAMLDRWAGCWIGPELSIGVASATKSTLVNPHPRIDHAFQEVLQDT